MLGGVNDQRERKRESKGRKSEISQRTLVLVFVVTPNFCTVSEL